jgi:hypothetical protein
MMVPLIAQPGNGCRCDPLLRHPLARAGMGGERRMIVEDDIWVRAATAASPLDQLLLTK